MSVRCASERELGVGADCLLGVHGLLERDAEFLAYRLKLLEVFLVLALVFDLELDTWNKVSISQDLD